MLDYVYSSPTYNSQNIERPKITFNRGMDTEMWYIYRRGYYPAIKNNDFIKFIGQWIELENNLLSKVTQAQKHTWYALISGY